MIGRSTLMLLLVASTAASQPGPKIPPLRLTQADVMAVPSTGAGAGTSEIAGIKTRVLAGDPTVPGPYTIVLQVPANTRIAAHTHRDDRVASVVSGTWYFGYGAKAGPNVKGLALAAFTPSQLTRAILHEQGPGLSSSTFTVSARQILTTLIKPPIPGSRARCKR